MVVSSHRKRVCVATKTVYPVTPVVHAAWMDDSCLSVVFVVSHCHSCASDEHRTS